MKVKLLNLVRRTVPLKFSIVSIYVVRADLSNLEICRAGGFFPLNSDLKCQFLLGFFHENRESLGRVCQPITCFELIIWCYLQSRLLFLLLLSSSSAHRGPGSPLSLTELALTIKFQMSSEHQGLWGAERVSFTFS